MKRSSLMILFAVVILTVTLRAPAARAETVVVSGVELRLPAEWGQKTKGPMTLLGPKRHKGRAIEVIALKAMPAASPEAFKALLGSEQLELPAVREITREGAKALVASGKVVTQKGQVDVDILVVAVGAKAAMLISFVGADQDPVIRKANREILASARIPGPRITIGYTAPRTAGLVVPPKPVVDGLTKIAEAFDRALRLPGPLAVTFEECGEVNAFYNQGRHAIRMCHDLYDNFVKLFTSVGMDRPEAERTASGAFMFTFLHEFGHALVGELGLPITGKGEDVADELATLLLSRGAKSQQIALAGAAWFEAKIKRPGHKDPYWSTHSFDSVRFESILCLLYGADKVAHGELMKQYKVPAGKLAKCERDAPLRIKAWEKMLEPYALKK